MSNSNQGIDAATVRHIARLARLDITDAEVASLGQDLGAILQYVDVLNELDLSEDQASDRGRMPLREDSQLGHLTFEALESNAPDASDRYFRVPKIIQGGNS